jgi:single-stranded-DNA-specific exonuclease
VGGHAMAAGFASSLEQVDNLEKEINAAYEKMPKTESELNNVYIDEEIGLDDVNWNNYNDLEKLRPFGMGNPKPNFLFSGITIGNVKKFGNGGIHLQLDFKNSQNKNISAIGFFNAGLTEPQINALIAGQKIDLVANIEKNTFRGANELRLRIVDLQIQ